MEAWDSTMHHGSDFWWKQISDKWFARMCKYATGDGSKLFDLISAGTPVVYIIREKEIEHV